MGSHGPQVFTETHDPSWPPEVGLILSALEAAAVADERRELRRIPYRVKAYLRLFADPPGMEERTLYTRDVNARSLGFLTPHRLPLGYGAAVRLPHPSDPQKLVTISCTLLRCREAISGWFEGAIYFHRERSEFSPVDD